jgi:hypothetical protein
MSGIWPQASGPGPGLVAAWIREQPFAVCLTCHLTIPNRRSA